MSHQHVFEKTVVSARLAVRNIRREICWRFGCFLTCSFGPCKGVSRFLSNSCVYNGHRCRKRISKVATNRKKLWLVEQLKPRRHFSLTPFWLHNNRSETVQRSACWFRSWRSSIREERRLLERRSDKSYSKVTIHWREKSWFWFLSSYLWTPKLFL